MTLKKLLSEYKKTRRETKKILENLKFSYNNLRFCNGEDMIKKLSEEEKSLLHQYEDDMEIVRSWISNLNYSIEWIRTGKKPDSKRGAERRSAYEREVPFEPYWIQRKKDERTIDLYNAIENANDEITTESTNQKERVTNDITRSLTERQKTMLTLSANGYSHSEIADLLQVSKGTVDVTIARSRAKIENEGWFMP